MAVRALPFIQGRRVGSDGESSSRLNGFLFGALRFPKPQGSLKNLKALSFVAIRLSVCPDEKRLAVACGPPV